MKLIPLIHLRNQNGVYSLEKKYFNPDNVSLVEPLSKTKAANIFSTADENKNFLPMLSEFKDAYSVAKSRSELTAIHTNGFCYYILGHWQIIIDYIEGKNQQIPSQDPEIKRLDKDKLLGTFAENELTDLQAKLAAMEAELAELRAYKEV